MKKALKLAAPALLLVAMVIVYHISPASRLAYGDIAGHAAMEDILFWSERGVMSGSEGKFRPDGSVTRAELATVLTRILPLDSAAENTFSDVEAGSWYEQAMLQCVAAGILDGSAAQLQPRAELTREEGFMMVARAFDIAPQEELRTLAGYNDSKNITPAYLGYMEALLRLDLVSGGNEVQLYPKAPLTRGELTMVLTKLLEGGYIQ